MSALLLFLGRPKRGPIITLPPAALFLEEQLDDQPSSEDFSAYMAGLRAKTPTPSEPAPITTVPEPFHVPWEEEEDLPLYPMEPSPIEGLIAHWTMDEASGATVNDAATNTYLGAVNGGFSWEAGALRLNGTSGHVDFGNQPNLIGPNRSYSMWLTPDVVSGQRGIISKISNSTGLGLLIEQNNATLRIFTNNIAPQLTAFGYFVVNVTVHCAVVFDNGTIRLYRDGEPYVTGSYSPIGNYPLAFLLGRQNNLARYFDGLIDDVQIYDHPLSAVEVETIYIAGPGG